MLLAQLYRLWAAARAVDLVKWIDYHKLSPLGEAQGSQASEELGLLAAGLLEQAQATNCDGAVLALDQSKAYDRVPLDLLAELLQDSGVHPAIGGRSDALHGEERSPHQGARCHWRQQAADVGPCARLPYGNFCRRPFNA